MTEAEKQELETQRIIKERALQVAMQQLEQLELERKQALEQYEVNYFMPSVFLICLMQGAQWEPN